MAYKATVAIPVRHNRINDDLRSLRKSLNAYVKPRAMSRDKMLLLQFQNYFCNICFITLGDGYVSPETRRTMNSQAHIHRTFSRLTCETFSCASAIARLRLGIFAFSQPQHEHSNIWGCAASSQTWAEGSNGWNAIYCKSYWRP